MQRVNLDGSIILQCRLFVTINPLGITAGLQLYSVYEMYFQDVLDTLCPTPDCIGYIIKIHVVRSDSLIKEVNFYAY